MNALQPQPDLSPRRPRPALAQPAPQGHPQRRSRTRSRRPSPHQSVILEVSLKLTVNLILTTIGVSTLVHLVPHNMSQQSDLERLRAEVKEASVKVGGLQEEFDRHFDPQQAVNVMQEQNIRFNPRQKQVVWLKPNLKDAPNKPSDAESGATSN